MVAQEVGVKLAHIDAVKGNVAFFSVVQAAGQFEHGAFTAADTAQNTDFFTRFDGQAQIFDGAVVVGLIFERYVFKGNIALNVVQSNVFAFRIALDRAGNDVVYAFEGKFGLLEAGGQTGDLCQWRQSAAGQNHRGNQCTHGDAFCMVVGMNQIGADDDQEDGIELLHGDGEVDHEVAGVFDFDGRSGSFGGVFVPALLRPRCGVVGFQGFDAFDGFNGKAGALRTFFHRFVDVARERALYDKTDNHDNRNDGQGNECQFAADHGNYEDKQQQERQVDNSQQAGTGHELAHGFKFAQVAGV